MIKISYCQFVTMISIFDSVLLQCPPWIKGVYSSSHIYIHVYIAYQYIAIYGPYMDHIWQYMVHIWPYMDHIWPYMDHIWPYMAHIWSYKDIYEWPSFALHGSLLASDLTASTCGNPDSTRPKQICDQNNYRNLGR